MEVTHYKRIGDCSARRDLGRLGDIGKGGTLMEVRKRKWKEIKGCNQVCVLERAFAGGRKVH